MPDSRGWSVLLPAPVVHITDRAATDMCTERVGHNGLDREDNNDGVCSKVDTRTRTDSRTSWRIILRISLKRYSRTKLEMNLEMNWKKS
jgi:hypothetical protein